MKLVRHNESIYQALPVFQARHVVPKDLVCQVLRALLGVPVVLSVQLVQALRVFLADREFLRYQARLADLADPVDQALLSVRWDPQFRVDLESPVDLEVPLRHVIPAFLVSLLGRFPLAHLAGLVVLHHLVVLARLFDRLVPLVQVDRFDQASLVHLENLVVLDFPVFLFFTS